MLELDFLRSPAPMSAFAASGSKAQLNCCPSSHSSYVKEAGLSPFLDLTLRFLSPHHVVIPPVSSSLDAGPD